MPLGRVSAENAPESASPTAASHTSASRRRSQAITSRPRVCPRPARARRPQPARAPVRPPPAPPPKKVYVLSAGDSAATIALMYGLPVSALKAANPKVDFNRLKPGVAALIRQVHPGMPQGAVAALLGSSATPRDTATTPPAQRYNAETTRRSTIFFQRVRLF